MCVCVCERVGGQITLRVKVLINVYVSYARDDNRIFPAVLAVGAISAADISHYSGKRFHLALYVFRIHREYPFNGSHFQCGS